MKNVVLGIDIGGTNTAFGLVDEEGNFICNANLPTQNYKKPELLVNDIVSYLNKHLEKNTELLNFQGIGIGAPNANYYNGTIEFAPNLPWKGVVNLIKLFGQHLSVPCYITNDANAAAIGESIFGVAKGKSNFIVITLGTGLGSGVYVNGDIVHGHDGFAGEIGHMVIDPNGRECGCGRKGCLETYVSATGIVRTAKIMLAKSAKKSILRKYDNNELDGKIITEAAQKGDQLSLEIFDFTANKLAFCLSNAMLITNPEAFIFFGGLAKANTLLLTPLEKYMDQYALEVYRNKVELLTSDTKENVAILGAAALAWSEIAKNKTSKQSINFN